MVCGKNNAAHSPRFSSMRHQRNEDMCINNMYPFLCIPRIASDRDAVDMMIIDQVSLGSPIDSLFPSRNLTARSICRSVKVCLPFVSLLHIMQMFIPSVLSAFQALLKCSHWLLWKVIKIFICWKKSILLHRPPSDSYPRHDFNGIGSQGGSLPLYHQSPSSHPVGSYSTATSQSTDYQTPPQSYLPHRQSGALHPAVTTPVIHPYTPVIRPVEHIQVRPSILHLMFTHLYNA